MRKVCYLLFIVYFLFAAGNVTIAAEETAAAEPPVLKAAEIIQLGATNAPAKNVTLGSTDPKSGFKFELDLTSRGAAISKAIFSEFDNRDPDPEERKKLVILSPVKLSEEREVLSMANKEFVFVKQQMRLPLDKLHWQSFDVESLQDGSQTARFEATIKAEDSGSPVIKLIKNYKVVPNSYLLDCELTIENLSSTEQKIRFNLMGPVGIDREDASRDDKKVVAGFRNSQGGIISVRLDANKLRKAKSPEDRRLMKPGADFLWTAAVNKYFAAILVPMPDKDKNFCDWVTDKAGRFYNPDGQPDTGDETVGVELKIAPSQLAAAGSPDSNSTKTYSFQLYLGPKDKSFFDKNDMYRNLGFVQTIDFMSCCCPAAIIQPLAFGILAIMKWMYGFIHNYGVVIIILVFLMRLVMHPVTKKSQVSMSKMSKLAPKSEEIKKKYANDKTEQNKQLMALYKEHGASPIMGMLPMLVQMPIWIALYSAIYASIDLRGAAFLPFWITDLSVPDALVRFSTVTVPLLGWKISSFNLLPILMGIAFYLQQKLMPAQTTASTPEAAQQQKMMMIMLPVLFPLMLYSSPSGLNLYIMASTFAGVIEQYVIKKHIREKEEAESQGLVAVTSKTGGKVKKKKPKPFFRT
ncbi:MAG: YidC/Oxa1 family insertase periplasmic-domain containing protein [Phycisphaerae bacterium]|nr:YidC/Oxa1 family insertase periplasmic-domain containing protein [Phycisphaerae bacterium]MDD5380520.1 YidC/Oxa1 family insertase periplasmic-domain containing protein [Phycisphaerae bacterium]